TFEAILENRITKPTELFPGFSTEVQRNSALALIGQVAGVIEIFARTIATFVNPVGPLTLKVDNYETQRSRSMAAATSSLNSSALCKVPATGISVHNPGSERNSLSDSPSTLGKG